LKPKYKNLRHAPWEKGENMQILTKKDTLLELIERCKFLKIDTIEEVSCGLD